MSVRTRRQKVAAMDKVDEKSQTTSNGVTRTDATPSNTEVLPQENIFLFLPNLVGKLFCTNAGPLLFYIMRPY